MYVHFIKCLCNIDIPVQMYIHVSISTSGLTSLKASSSTDIMNYSFNSWRTCTCISKWVHESFKECILLYSTTKYKADLTDNGLKSQIHVFFQNLLLTSVFKTAKFHPSINRKLTCIKNCTNFTKYGNTYIQQY